MNSSLRNESKTSTPTTYDSERTPPSVIIPSSSTAYIDYGTLYSYYGTLSICLKNPSGIGYPGSVASLSFSALISYLSPRPVESGSSYKTGLRPRDLVAISKCDINALSVSIGGRLLRSLGGRVKQKKASYIINY